MKINAITAVVFALAALAGCSGEDERIPATLQASALDTVKDWTPMQVELAAKTVAKQLRGMDRELAAASDKGDRSAAVAMLDPATHILRTWNDHQASPGISRYHDCLVAAIDLADGIQAVMSGGAYTQRERFKKAVGGCQNP